MALALRESGGARAAGVALSSSEAKDGAAMPLGGDFADDDADEEAMLQAAIAASLAS